MKRFQFWVYNIDRLLPTTFVNKICRAKLDHDENFVACKSQHGRAVTNPGPGLGLQSGQSRCSGFDGQGRDGWRAACRPKVRLGVRVGLGKKGARDSIQSLTGLRLRVPGPVKRNHAADSEVARNH
jgi:hypothetical protein